MTLFARAGVPLPQEYVVDLLTQGDWNLLQQFTQEQRMAQDLSPDRFKNLLTNYIRCRSLMAAKILLEWDREFILKKFEDPDLMAFIDLFPEKSTSLEQLLKELIASPRSDAIWKKAAEKLFAFAGLPIPDPYDHQVTLKTFVGDRIIVPPKKASGPLKGKKTHVVQQGENLWKIARKYKVSIDSLRKANNLQTDKLRPGKELIIMDDLSRPDSKDGNGKSGAP
jgi:hypothetical protein